MNHCTKLKVGEPVYTVGAPQGLELSLSEGIVSQLRGGPPPIIQTTAAVSPGSSGGGLFNAEGELVGITTLQVEGGQNLNFAVPVEWIGQVARAIVREQPIGEAPVAPAPGTSQKEGWDDRGRPPVRTRFTKAKDGVISDSATGLEWYVGPDQDTNWNQAKSWTESLTVARGGWRMPTIPELKALYQEGAGPRNIDPKFQTTGVWVWSGQTGGPASPGYPASWGAWGFYFLRGEENRYLPGNAQAIGRLRCGS